MNYKMMGRFIAQIVSMEALFLLPALVISVCHGETKAVFAFLWTLAIMLAVVGLLYGICRKAGKLFGAKEGLVCVSLSWIVMSMLGCLPFVFSGSIPSYIDALFETVSGFTTTGASILTDVEVLPKGILYWRSFSHWVGGMGVLVFLLALSPGVDQGKGFTMHLLRAESPGPDVGKLVPKMRTTATILYTIYIVMTVINFVLLLLGNMDWLDALCTAFGTAGTGGFGVKNDSMASFSPYIQNVTTIFMFLFGVNFSCYYLILLGNFKSVFKDEELRFYIVFAVGIVALIAFNIRHMYPTLEETIRHAAFQVSSIITTTGYGTTDFNLWPTFSKGLLMLLMVTGACAGSTCGGLKLARAMLLFKSLRRNIRQVLNPRKVQVVRINGKVVDESVLDNANAYLAAYVIIIIFCFIMISLDGFSVEANFSAVLSCFNNIGPGLAEVGPTSNYSCYSDLSTFLLTIAMLAGRLEIFPILVLLTRSTWTRK
jgi:trk system potassium uptake protein TrkH